MRREDDCPAWVKALGIATMSGLLPMAALALAGALLG